jgi:hypothetical protein
MKKLLLLLALFSPASLCAQTQPFLRAKFIPGPQVIVGEPLRLQVDVLVPNYFTGAPDFPAFELDGAIVTLSDDRPQHLNEQKNGNAYAGIRRFYVIYPEQPGKFQLPPAQISVPYAAAPPETTQATLSLPSLSFSAALPPEARNLDYFLPTTQLKIHQQWSAPLAHLRVGDSISRTVVVTAQKTQAMFIPPLQFPAPEGIRVYPKIPSVENQKSPIGEFLAGVRTERTSYLLTKPGDYTLPEVKITWWNLATHKLTSSVLPAATIHVDAADAYVSELPPEPSPVSPAPVAAKHRDYRLLLTLAVATVVFLPLFALALRRWGPLLVRRSQAARDRWHNSEPANFHRLKQALHRNNATQSYALLIAWIRRRCSGMTLDQFQTEINDPRLDQQLLVLSRFLFAPSPSSSWQDGPSLAAFLARYRRRSLARIYRSTVQLPPLNPSRNRQTILP